MNGQGSNLDEAKKAALRNAIEQAFGAFISSKTEIVNDNLIKDEIISIANGNIQKYETLSEVQLPQGQGYATTLKAVVSVTKLTSFCERKGLEIEFKGSLFAFNIEQQKLNENNEFIAVKNIIQVTKSILKQAYSASLTAGEPLSAGGDLFYLPVQVDISVNENANNAIRYLYESIRKIAMSNEEIANYLRLNKPVYLAAFFKSPELISGPIKFWEWDYNGYNGRLNSLKEIGLPEYVQNKSQRRYFNGYLKGGIESNYPCKSYTHEFIYFRNSNSFMQIQELVDYCISIIKKFQIKSNLGNANFQLQFLGGVPPVHESNEKSADEMQNRREFEIAYSSYCPYFWTNSAQFLDKNYEKDMNRIWKNYTEDQIGGKSYLEKSNPLVLHEFNKNSVVCKAYGNITLTVDEIKKISAFSIAME